MEQKAQEKRPLDREDILKCGAPRIISGCSVALIECQHCGHRWEVVNTAVKTIHAGQPYEVTRINAIEVTKNQTQCPECVKAVNAMFDARSAELEKTRR